MARKMDVFPSRMVLMGLNEQRIAATIGWNLLKKKSDHIKKLLQDVLKKILQVKRRVGKGCSDSFFSLQDAHWSAGDFNARVIESVTEPSMRFPSFVKNVSGVKIPNFSKQSVPGVRQESIVGLVRGGEEVATCRTSFQKLLVDVVELAALQASLQTLDEALKVTNRRVNALEFVVLPSVLMTIDYVKAELDEMEREDTFRIKKVKDNAAKQMEAEEEDKRKHAALVAEESGQNKSALASFGKDEEDVSDLFA